MRVEIKQREGVSRRKRREMGLKRAEGEGGEAGRGRMDVSLRWGKH